MIHRFGTQTRIDAILPSQSYISHRSQIEQHEPALKIYDPQSPDMTFAAQIAQEIIHISGANVLVYTRTENHFDEVWEEDADPVYRSGQSIKAYFAPQPMKSELTPWGYDTPNQTTVVFCRDELYRMLGKRMIIEDDIIEIPYNAAGRKIPDRYRVLNAFDSGQFRYNWLYYSCVVENITDDKTLDITHK